MHRLLLPMLALALGACDQVDKIKDTVDSVTNPTVIIGLDLGVEPPDSELIDLDQTPFGEGASAKVFLARADSLSNLEDNLVSGATVTLISASNGGGFVLEDQGDGTYTGKGSDGLSYEAEDVTIKAEDDDGVHSLSVGAPQATDASIASTHGAGQPMSIDLSDQDYDGALVVVLDLDGGITFSNQPETVTELYDFAYGDGGDLLHVEIPGAAFEQPGVYAIGVAGTRNSAPEDMTDINTALSTLIAAKFRFYPVEVN